MANACMHATMERIDKVGAALVMHEVWNEHKTVAIVTYRSSKLKRLVWNGMEWNKMREMSIVAISAAAMISQSLV